MSFDYGYSYDVGSAVGAGLGAIFGFLLFFYVISVVTTIFTLICNWKVFKKAGKNGWEAIIPIYNFIVLLEITELPMWYLILFLLPVGNIIVLFLTYIELAKKFGQSTAFGIGLTILNPIFIAILAFNKDYVYKSSKTNSQSSNVKNNDQSVDNQITVQKESTSSQSIENTTVIPLVQNKYCTSCGTPANLSDKFCMNCGNKL